MSNPHSSNQKKKGNLFTGNNEKENDLNDEQFERGQHPNSLANLQPFPKGVSGNPSGRPQKYENLKEVLNEYGDGETFNWRGESEGTRRKQVWKMIWKQAIMGDMKFIQLLAQLGCLDEKSHRNDTNIP